MSQPTAYRWYAAAVLFLVSVLNTIDKSLIPALAEPIRLEFDLSDSELGLLVGLVFSVAYGLASIPIGLLIAALIAPVYWQACWWRGAC